MKTFAKNFKGKERKLEEFNEEIEDIAAAAQDKFAHELENIAYESVQKFRSLLAKELNFTFNNIHSQNVNLLKSVLKKRRNSVNTFSSQYTCTIELLLQFNIK